MNDRAYRSDRHQRLAHIHPTESTSWKKPSTRSYAACQSGPCEQGKKLCPSPQACQRADRDSLVRSLTWLVLLLVGIFVLGSVFSFIAWSVR